MAIGIDPLVDYVCKKLLGSPEHSSITLHFLNAILRGRPRITCVEILNPILGKEFEEDKYSILDVRARDALGNRFNIEIQRSLAAALRERLTYYVAAQLVEQLGSGDGYPSLRPSIGICILDGILFPHVSDLHLDFRLMNAKYQLTLTDHMQIHLLELPKYIPPRHNQVIADPIDQWCYFFAQAKESTAEELERRLPDPVFIEAIGVLEMIARDPEERSLYNARLKMERDSRAQLEYAISKGLEEGIERGLQQGLQQGQQQGEAIGRVKALRDLSEETSPADDELLSYSREQLMALAQKLQDRLRGRN